MIIFNEEKHTYTNKETGELYSSVSSIISKYKEPFKATTFNTRSTEERLGLTHNEVIEYWKEINKKSIERGNYIHKEIEAYLLGNNYKVNYNEYTKEVPYQYLDKLLKKRAKRHIEKLVYDHSNKIAGTPDLVFEYKNRLEVYDWKTNTKDLHSNYKGKKLLSPYQYLLDCSYSIYLLQAHYYNKMLESIHNKKVTKNVLVHIWDNYKEGYKEIDITKDLKKIK